MKNPNSNAIYRMEMRERTRQKRQKTKQIVAAVAEVLLCGGCLIIIAFAICMLGA